MTRYTLTAEDRRKGGITTSQKYDMRARGRRGLQKLADKYFAGNVKKAGKALSTMGNIVIDPFPQNGAWRRLYDLPVPLLQQFWGHCEPDDPDGVPF